MTGPESVSVPAGGGTGAREGGGLAGPGRRWHKGLHVAVGLVLLVLIFVGVIPQFTSYAGTWRHMDLRAYWWVTLAALAILSQLATVWPYQAVLPGLRFSHGLLETETTSAISGTVPGGGAVAVGMTYKMFSSFGFSDADISTAVVITGVWNLASKLALPVISITLLAASAHPPRSAIAAAASGGVVLALTAVVFYLVFRSESTARFVGHLLDRFVNWVLHFFHRAETDRAEQAVLKFRRQTIETARSRGWRLTWAVLVGQLVVLLLVLVAVRAVGISSDRVGFAAVLTSFAVARLAGAVPITPGGLGTVDAAFVAMLTTFGADTPHALAADFIWRLTTYLPPLILGIVAYLVWMRREDRGAGETGAVADVTG